MPPGSPAPSTISEIPPPSMRTLRRTQVAADEVRADAGAELEQLRGQLDTVLDDRTNADDRRPSRRADSGGVRCGVGQRPA
ncbi:hypothetical protein [Rhodococcus sp. NPDC057529]|uniref:hypothetical protein n=1 Tax=Rhodococcus sp. NPDC057529 TaxID=3346158 RepID=UPI00367262E8